MGLLSDLLNWFKPTPSVPVPHPLTTASRTDLVVAINKARSSRGLGPLSLVSRLNTLAQDWTITMAQLGRLSHGNFWGRISTTFPGTAAAEDIAAGQRSVDEVVGSWMRSPLHRANILGHFNSIGVGIAIASDGTIYWCIDFDYLA